MSIGQVVDYCLRDWPKDKPDALNLTRSLSMLVMRFVNTTLEKLTEPRGQYIAPYLQPYVDWMVYQWGRFHDVATSKAGTNWTEDADEPSEDFLNAVALLGIRGKLLTRLGTNLITILRGEFDVMNLFFNDRLMDQYYEEMLDNQHHFYPVGRYIDLLAFKNPGMTILEIGAGTGGQTLACLQTLSSGRTQRWARYDYTDISPSFFDQTREKLTTFAQKLTFKTLDAERDPIEQGFAESSYDLVIASHVCALPRTLSAFSMLTLCILGPSCYKGHRGCPLAYRDLAKTVCHASKLFHAAANS